MKEKYLERIELLIESFKSNRELFYNLNEEDIQAIEELLKELNDIKEIDLTQVYLKGIYDEREKSTSIINNKINEIDKKKLNYDSDLRIYTLRDTFDFQKEILKEILEEWSDT